MKDGNRLFTSYYSVDILNKYNGISSANKKVNACIYIDEFSKNAYTSICPEQQEALDKAEQEEKDKENLDAETGDNPDDKENEKNDEKDDKKTNDENKGDTNS